MNDDQQPANAPGQPDTTVPVSPQPTPDYPPLANEQPPVDNQPPFPPQSQPQPQLQPQPQPVFQPQPQFQPAVPVTSPKKSSHLALWISLAAVVVVLLVCLVGGYFVAKAMSDSKAHTYTKAAASYLDDMKSKINSSTDASEAQKDFSSIPQPKLETAFLSGVSSDYKDAQATQSDVNAEADKVKTELDNLAGVDKFYKDYGDLANNVEAVSSSMMSSSRSSITEGLTKLTSLIESGKTIVDKATLPSELDGAKSDVTKALTQEVSSLKAMSAAFAANDSAAYYDALNTFTTAAGDEEKALAPIRTYYNDLNNKKEDIVKDITTLRGKVDAGTNTADA